MSDSFWPETAESWSTLIANTIAIGTFVFGAPPIIRWASSLHSELSETRRRLTTSDERGFPDYAPRQHIKLIEDVDGAPEIWTAGISQQRSPSAENIKVTSLKITNKRLLKILRAQPERIKGTDGIVVGAVTYIDHGDHQSDFNLVHLDWAPGDGPWRKWSIEVRRWLFR